MEVRELGDSSIAVLRRKLEHLAAEFREMAAIDATLPPARRRSAGMLLALRPWVFSLLDSLRGAEPGQTDTGKGSGGLPGAASRHRSEKRRDGKECVSTCEYRWVAAH